MICEFKVKTPSLLFFSINVNLLSAAELNSTHLRSNTHRINTVYRALREILSAAHINHLIFNTLLKCIIHVIVENHKLELFKSHNI